MLIQSLDLAAAAGIKHAFFTRRGGGSSGIYASLNGGVGSADDPAAVRRNRATMAASLGLAPERLLSLHQVHSATALPATEPWDGPRPKADGMATRTPGLALAIASADCGPILFADPATGVIGAAHAGWKGALTGVLEATIDLMETLGAARRSIVAVLGPTIGPGAYEVGPEFEARFLAEASSNARFFQPSGRDGHAWFDLPRYVGSRLERAGIGKFTDLGLCTYSDEALFFSYRRATHRGEPDYGRLISAIALAE